MQPEVTTSAGLDCELLCASSCCIPANDFACILIALSNGRKSQRIQFIEREVISRSLPRQVHMKHLSAFLLLQVFHLLDHQERSKKDF